MGEKKFTKYLFLRDPTKTLEWVVLLLERGPLWISMVQNSMLHLCWKYYLSVATTKMCWESSQFARRRNRILCILFWNVSRDNGCISNSKMYFFSKALLNLIVHFPWKCAEQSWIPTRHTAMMTHKSKNWQVVMRCELNQVFFHSARHVAPRGVHLVAIALNLVL